MDEDLRGILKFIGTVLAGILSFIGIVAGLVVFVNAWDCTFYEGAQTKMMGGTCYVKQTDGKWVLFDSYVREVNLNVEKK